MNKNLPVANYKPYRKEHLTKHGSKIVVDFYVDHEQRPAGGEVRFYTSQDDAWVEVGYFKFQDGPIGVSGHNGGFVEDLMLAIVERLGWYQTGIYSCKENACAITDTESAENWLNRRTDGRRARGVEGTHRL